MLKGIVFDKDGTLIDYDKLWAPIVIKALTELFDLRGLDTECKDVKDLIDTFFCHGTYADTAEKLNFEIKAKLGIDTGFTTEDLCTAYKNNLQHGNIVPLCDDLENFLTLLKDKGIRLAVVTSDEPSSTKSCLEKLGVYHLFDAVYCDDLVHPPKPDPYYMECFCREFSMLPAEVLMIGDKPYDMQFAKNSGAIAFGVSSNESGRNDLLYCADYIGNDITDIMKIPEFGPS